MLARLHSHATAAPKVQADIQASDEPAWNLAERYGTTGQNVRDLRQLASVEDRSHTPHRLQTTLTSAQEAVGVALFKTLLVSLDDLATVAREFLNPNVSRSGLDRCLCRHGKLPALRTPKRVDNRLSDEKTARTDKARWVSRHAGWQHSFAAADELNDALIKYRNDHSEVAMFATQFLQSHIPGQKSYDATPLSEIVKFQEIYYAVEPDIPEAQLVAVRSKDLRQDLPKAIRRILKELSLGDHRIVPIFFEQNEKSTKGYNNSTLDLDPELVALSNAHWGDCFERCGHESVSERREGVA